MRPEPTPATCVQIAFLTGQSDARRCGLGPQQMAFLSALHGPGRQPVALNFPWLSRLGGHAPVLLPLAALRNGWQYLASRHPSFAKRHRSSVLRLVSAAPHTVLLAGSCGLELLANLRLPAQATHRISVFAYGPVARSTPACARLLCVRGAQDGISLRGYHGEVVEVGGGHMDYLLRPEVQALCERFIGEVAAEVGACAST